MAKRKFFNSAESQPIQREKERLKYKAERALIEEANRSKAILAEEKKQKRKLEYQKLSKQEREKLEEFVRPQLQRKADISKLAELLATQVVQAEKKVVEKFEISLEEIDKKLPVKIQESKFEISLEEIQARLGEHK